MWFMDKTQVLRKSKDPLYSLEHNRKARSQASVIPGLPENSQKPGGQLVWSLQWKHKNKNKTFQTKQDGRQGNTQGCPLTSIHVLWRMWTHTDIHEHTHTHTRQMSTVEREAFSLCLGRRRESHAFVTDPREDWLGSGGRKDRHMCDLEDEDNHSHQGLRTTEQDMETRRAVWHHYRD